MSLLSKIIDGTGSKSAAKVTVNNELLVTTGLGIPPFGLTQRVVPFRQHLTTNGEATGTSSMLVNGSSTNVEYYVQANSTNDRYVSVMQFLIADTVMTLNKFGGITALTNGCQLFYSSKLTGVQYLHLALKSNFDFIRLSRGNPSFGGGAADAFLAGDVIGNSDAYIPNIDISQIIPPYGLKLDAGSDQKLTFKIRDNVSTIDAFDCIVSGFERLPDL